MGTSQNAFVQANGDIWLQISESENTIIRYFSAGQWNTINPADGVSPKSFILLGVLPDGKPIIFDSNYDILAFDGAQYQKTGSCSQCYGQFLEASSVYPDGSIIFSLYDYQSRSSSGLLQFSGGKTISLSDATGLPDQRVNAVSVDESGAIWVGTPSSLLQQAGEKGWLEWTVPNDFIFGASDITPLEDGSIWFPSFGNGLLHLTPNTQTAYDLSSGIADNYFQSSTAASDGTLWFGTWENGMVSMLNGQQWTNYGPEDGLVSNDNVYAMASSPDGTIWAGTQNGLGMYDGRIWKMILPNGDLSFRDLRSIAVAPNGDVWVGAYDFTAGGKAARLSAEEWTIFDKTSGLDAGAVIMAMAITADDSVFAGTYNGLFHFDGARWNLVPNSPTYINDIAVAQDGSLWVATEFNGVQHYDGSRWDKIYSTSDGLPVFRCNSVAVDSTGALWMSSEFGVVKIVNGVN